MRVCFRCGLKITFKRSKKGKWVPTNPDGSHHGNICSETAKGLKPTDQRALKAYEKFEAEEKIKALRERAGLGRWQDLIDRDEP